MPLFILALFFLCTPIHKAQAAYAFPIHDPYYATLTAALLKADDRDPQSQYEDIKLKPLPQRDNVPFYSAKQNRITVRFWPAKNKTPAPLVFMLAGLGGTASNSYLNFLGHILQKNGYQAIALPSAMNWNFALSVSSSGYPGIAKYDTQDLQNLMLLALEHLKLDNVAIKNIGLVGISLGAANAGFLSVLDKEEKKIGFQRILLINPPVDNLFALQQLDGMRNEKDNLSRSEIKALKTRAIIYGANNLLRKDINSPSYFADIETKLATTVTERRFLIGESMREFLPGLLFTTQQINDLGILKTPIAEQDAKKRLEEADEFSFFDYLQIFLMKYMQTIHSDYNLERLNKDSSLLSLAEELRQDTRVFVMHNEDDMIVNAKQLGELREVFGQRATIYPLGGHVGNLWFPQNQQDILQVLSVLK